MTIDQIFSTLCENDFELLKIDLLDLSKVVNLSSWYLDSNIATIYNWISRLFVGLPTVR